MPSNGKASGAGGPARPPALVAVTGEFNAGKSSVANLIVGAPVLVTGPEFSDMPVQELRAAPDPRAPSDGRVVHLHPCEALEDLVVAEVPIDQGGRISAAGRATIERADVIVWCTMAQRAWGLSESRIVKSFSQEARGRALMVVTRADYLQTAKARDKVMQRMARQAGDIFQTIAALDASDPTVVPRGGSWQAEGLDALRAGIATLVERRPEPARSDEDGPSQGPHAAWAAALEGLLAEARAAGDALHDEWFHAAIADRMSSVAAMFDEEDGSDGQSDPGRRPFERAYRSLGRARGSGTARTAALHALDVAVQLERELSLPQGRRPEDAAAVGHPSGWAAYDPPDLARLLGDATPH